MYHSLMLLAGMLVLFRGVTLPGTTQILLLTLLFLALYWFKPVFFRLLATFLLGYCWAGGFAIFDQANNLPKSLVKQSAVVSGCIVGLKIHSPNYQRLMINVSNVSVRGEPIAFDGKVSLAHYAAIKEEIAAGWCGTLTAKLKPVHGRLNHRGFDYEAWAYVQNIKALGTLKKLHDFKAGDDLYSRYLQFKSTLVSDLSRSLKFSDSYALVISLALGERDLIKPDVWEILRHSGTSHLLAISGLHIGLVFWMTSTLTTIIWRRIGFLTSGISAQKAGWLWGLIFAGGYLVLTGLPLSGRRAWVMLACCVLIWVIDKRADFKFTFMLALWVVLLIWPKSILSIGFWFSFIAVALILSQFVHLNINLTSKPEDESGQLAAKIKKWVQIQCLLSFAISPLNVAFFGELSLISPLANLVAVPLVTFILLPAILVGSVLHLSGFHIGSEFILLHSVTILDWLFKWLSTLVNIDGSLLKPQINNQYGWYCVLAGIFVIYHFRFWPGRWMLCILMLPILVSQKDNLQRGEFELSVFDVGQGLAVWFKSANHHLLIDTGFGVKDGFNHFDTVIYPVLKAGGVNTIDAVVISHGDADHAGGLDAIIDSDLDINRVYTSKLAAKNDFEYCDKSITWQWDGITFSFLTQDQVVGENNQSCVLLMRGQYGSVLLPGDIELDSELKLVREYGRTLAANLLIVPHHGSVTSSNTYFLRSVNPGFAVISAGYLNRYGHPAQTIINRYRKNNIKLFNTACQGQLNFLMKSSGITYQGIRRAKQPFWRHQCAEGNVLSANQPPE